MKRLLALISVFTLSVCAAHPSNAQTSDNALTVNQWVQPAADGVLQGRIVIPAANGTSAAVEGASVAIMSNDGKLLQSVDVTNSKGEFTINDVKPGVYALTARGENVFAAYAMHVLDNSLVGENEFPAQVEVSAANVDFTTVKTAVIRYLAPAAEMNPASIQGAELADLASRVCGNQSFRVAQSNGGLKGRLHAAGSNNGSLTGAQLTNVFIFENGQEIARTITNDNGEFQIAKIGTGNYSLMAVGSDGLGLIGFELVGPTSAKSAAVTTDGKQFVGLPNEYVGQELSMQIAPVNMIQETVSLRGCRTCGSPAGQCTCHAHTTEFVPTQPTYQAHSQSYGGGGGGGYGGGGGGFHGGGGFGGLAGLAAVGGLIAIELDDDDDKIKKVKPLSPWYPYYN